MARLAVRIVGQNLPGLRFFDYEPVHVGLRRGREVEHPMPADFHEVVFDLFVDIRPDRDGQPDYRGPYITGMGKHDRAIGLSWGTVDVTGHFELFRAAKLRLPPIDDELEQAASNGSVLRGTVNLTDDFGAPVCARVPEASLRWELLPTAHR